MLQTAESENASKRSQQEPLIHCIQRPNRLHIQRKYAKFNRRRKKVFRIPFSSSLSICCRQLFSFRYGFSLKEKKWVQYFSLPQLTQHPICSSSLRVITQNRKPDNRMEANCSNHICYRSVLISVCNQRIGSTERNMHYINTSK